MRINWLGLALTATATFYVVSYLSWIIDKKGRTKALAARGRVGPPEPDNDWITEPGNKKALSAENTTPVRIGD